MPGIDASDLLKLMDPKMTKKKELEQQIIQLRKVQQLADMNLITKEEKEAKIKELTE